MKLKNSLRVLRAMLLALVLGAPMMANAQMPDPSQMQLPIDGDVRIGQLPNGLTYYIRHNEKPKGQADFYIAQKVGSIQEEDNQRGLAHFLEHMCFNGTKNFPGNSMIDWLETIGVKFGDNLNAYTSIDETVYNISNVPIARESVQDSCLLILHDWSNELLLEDSEIDNERGVIHQEWRSRNKGSMRIFDEILPRIYPTSKYGHRMPIGTMEVVDNFPYQALRDYYETWYRPDLQGIVVVGDIDVDRIESKIKDMFSDIPAAGPNAATREYYPVPDHEGTIYGIGKDPEQTNNIIELMFISDPLPDAFKNTPIYLQIKYMEQMIGMMLDNRFEEMASKPDAPFAAASADFDGFFLSGRTKDAFTVVGVAKGSDIYPVYEAIYRETLRAARNGFTAAEYERVKADYLASMEQAYNNRDSRQNEQFVNVYVRNFLDATPILDAETRWMIAQQLVAAVPVEVINEYMQGAVTDDNRVVVALLADKPGLVFPTEEGLAEIVAAVNAEDIEPYQKNVKEEPLIENLRPAGSIVDRAQNEQWGTTEWTLSNGIKVVVKPTQFKADQILFDAVALDGTASLSSKYNDDVMFGSYSFDNYGLGTYTNLDLKDYLAGKQVGLTFSFDDYVRDIEGSSTPKDLETLMELVYMAFTDVRYDATEFAALQGQMTGLLQHQIGTPGYVFNEMLLSNLYKAPTQRMITPEIIAAATPEGTTEIVHSFTANPADYTMYFIGNVDMEKLEALVVKYIASLPTNPAMVVNSVAEYDPSYFIAPGVLNVNETIEMDTPQTYVAIIESGIIPFTIKNQKLAQIAGEVLTKRLLTTVREDWGAVYSIGASGSLRRQGADIQNASISSVFPMTPDQKEKVLDFIANEIKAMETNITAEEIAPVIEYMVKNNQEGMEENESWLSALYGVRLNGVDTFLGAVDTLNAITPQDVMDYMKALNAQGNYKVIILDPAQ